MSNNDVTFLVVDDDGMVRDILVQYLKSFGFTNILEAKDGKVALKFIRNPSQKIDFIISDWEMPHIDGLTLLRALRREPGRTNVKFVMVTSQGSHERMKITKAAKARVDAYIVKPFRSDLLKEKLNTLLNGGIDESSAQFERDILGAHGGNLVNIDDDEEKIGAVELNEEAQDNGDVYTGGDFDENNPPLDFDITQLNIILVLKLVNAYKKAKKYDLAKRLCIEADDHFPDNADVLFNLGHCYYLTEKYPEAEECLRKAIKLKPYHVESFTLLNEMQRLQKTGS